MLGPRSLRDSINPSLSIMRQCNVEKQHRPSIHLLRLVRPCVEEMHRRLLIDSVRARVRPRPGTVIASRVAGTFEQLFHNNRPMWSASRRHAFHQSAWLSTAASKAEAEPAEGLKSTNEPSLVKRRDHAAVRKRRAALRKRRRHLQRQRSSLPDLVLMRHEEAAFVSLYERLVSDYPKDKIVQVIKRLNKVREDADKDESIDLSAALLRVLQRTHAQNQAQIKVLEFLLSTDYHSPVIKTATKVDDGMSDHMEVLLRALDRSFLTGLTWGSRLDAKLKASKRVSLAKQRGRFHAKKSLDVRKQEAKSLVHFLRNHLPTSQYESSMELFRAYGTSGDDEAAENGTDDDSQVEGTQRAFNIRKLGGHLLRRTDLQFAVVAKPVADFFYLSHGYDAKVVDVDPLFIDACDKWKSLKQEFVETLLSVQERLVTTSGEDIELDASNTSSVVDEAEEVLEDAEIELELSQQALIQSTVGRDARYRRPAHLVFEAMPLHEATDSTSPSAILPSQTTVFLDNLPVDITEQKLLDLYARCGDIKNIQIYNQRPDLDPGPLSLSQLKRRRAKQLKSVSGRFRRWQRPRTPVYASVAFADPEGYRLCVDDSLRIFGVIIEKHPVRSLRAADMTRLYLEGLPEGVPCVDLEFELNQQLHPDLFVCLGAGQNSRAKVGSCELQFPSFEVALESFDKLTRLDIAVESPDFEVNWLRTPKDAEAWWTRKRGFD